MENSDKNIFPEIKILNPMDAIFKIGKFVTDRFYTDVPNTGASVMLDEWPLESDGIEL